MTDRWRRHLEGLLGVPATEGNTIDALFNGAEIFPAMLTAIQDADTSVDLLSFVYWTGPIARTMAETLAERARAGCRVRVLLDAVGARNMDRGLVGELRDAGARVRFFRPPTSLDNVTDGGHRTHRRVLICDEEVAFTGGVGIAEEWEGDARDPSEWRDTHFRVTGPAVDGLRAAFLHSWMVAGGALLDEGVDRFPTQQQDPDGSVVQVIRGDDTVGGSATMTLKRALVRLASERLRITTAYFAPDDDMRSLLVDAAQRGVEVEVLVPGENADKRVAQLAGQNTYEELLEAGVRIWHYEPTMLHAKTITVDGEVADVGSSNFNNRSMRLDQEVDLVVFDRDLVGTLDAQFDEDLARSELIDPDTWQQRGPVQRAGERAAEVIDDHT